MRSEISAFRPLCGAVLALALTACGEQSSAAGEVAAPVDSAEIVAEVESAPPLEAVGPTTGLPPNELGQIMVLEYHRLGEPEGEWRRSIANFRADLQRLYDAGYRPITMRDVLEGNINVPRGTTPVVFTMDDSSQGQFYFRDDGSIDPNTMVGMWDAFQKENPGWAGGAVWCVLPAADHPSNFFGEKPSREVPRQEREATIKRKVDYLVENGHEICNHTLYHARLDQATSDAQVQEWIGRGEDSIQVYLPEGYDIVTHALPLGMWPKNRPLAWAGTYNGRPYEYKGVLEVAGGPNESPYDRAFDPHSINRLIVAPRALERALADYEANPGKRFISDGLPDVISVAAADSARVATDRWPNKRIQIVE